MGQVYGKYFVINFLDLEISFFSLSLCEKLSEVDM